MGLYITFINMNRINYVNTRKWARRDASGTVTCNGDVESSQSHRLSVKVLRYTIMSSFASHHVHSLLRAAQSVSTTPADEGAVLSSQDKTEQFSQEEELYSLLLQLKSPLDGALLRSTLVSLGEQRNELISGESSAIHSTLQGRIVVGLYAEALDQWLKEASDADTEAEWWDGVARSSRSISLYFIASKQIPFATTFPILMSLQHSLNV